MKEPLPPPARVQVVDIEMSFGNMIIFMVKATIAAIPALFILVMCGVVFYGLTSAFMKR
jgi:hypothetical protein